MERRFGPEAALEFEVESHLPRSAARVAGGEVPHLEAHFQRLRASATALGWKMDWLESELPPVAAWASEQARSQDLALRLHLRSRQLRALLEEIPPTPSPYLLRPTPHPLGHPCDEPLAPHKGLTGLWGAEAMAAARAAGASDALLHWPDGTLVETGIASIGLERHGELWIPPAEGRIASLAERLQLPDWSRDRQLRVVMKAFDLASARSGQLWCFNALRGIWPAILMEGGR